MNDLLVFNISQIILVIISGYFIVLGFGVFVERLNLLTLRYYQVKKLKVKEKIEQIELEKKLEEIDKVEPND